MSNIYKSDYFFKLALSEESEECHDFIKFIIKSTTSINPVSVEIKNAELPPEPEKGKLLVVDVLVQDRDGTQYDIEMQVSPFDMVHQIRFLHYIARLYSGGIDKGEDYRRARTCLQIIFIDDEISPGELISEYRYMNHHHHELASLRPMRSYFVSMPMINKLNKSVSEMSAFEQLIYLFENGRIDDTIALENKEVTYIMNKYNKFTAEDYKRKQEYDEALLEAMGDLYREIDFDDGKKAGIEIGRIEGIEIGRTEGIEIGKSQGINIGELNKTLSILRRLLDKGKDQEEILDIMDITAKELEELKKKL